MLKPDNGALGARVLTFAKGEDDAAISIGYDFEVGEGVVHAPWRVRRVEIAEELSGECAATVHLQNDDPLANERELRGRSAALLAYRPNLAERRFSGIVRTVVSEGIDARGVRGCRVTLVPAFQCLDETIEWRKFVDLTVPEILLAVLREGLEPFGRKADLRLNRSRGSAANPFARREYTAQRGESTCQFVRRLCAEEGLGLWYDYSGPTETLVVTDDNQAFGRLGDTIRLVPPDGAVAGFEHVHAFETASHRTPTAAAVTRFDLTRPMLPLLERVQLQPAPADAGSAGAAEIYDPTGAVTLHEYRGDRYTAQDVGHQARIRLEAAQVWGHVGSGQGSVLAFQPGLVFDLDVGGAYPSPLEGEYLLVKVLHQGEASRGPASGDPFAGSYRNSFECIPFDVPFRPRRLPRPIAGLDHAIVAAVSEEDPIHHDVHGRVKLKFWWDRTPGAPTEKDSGWVPVASAWAGNGRGIQALPRRGDVVIVNYDLGDPDRPVVVASANTATNSLLYDLANKTAVAWRTQSQRPDGQGGFSTPNFNEILMDDRAEGERFLLHAGWNFDRRVLNDDTTRVDHDENRTVGNDQNVTVMANQSLTVQGNQTKSVTKSSTINVTGNRSLTVNGAETVTVGGTETVTVSGARTTKVVGAETVTLSQRQTEVSGSDQGHVAGDGRLTIDGTAKLTNGGTTIECAAGWVELSAATWVRIKHGGAEVLIDEAENVSVTTGADVTVQGNKLTLNGGSAIELSVGGSAVKIDASGVNITGPAITQTADGEHRIVASTIRNN
jgi:type VI secretion system secreted protein VgrG